ncbi:MAG: glycine--tRNA ligase subunit beta, partial [Nitrosomonas sp.]|nr:glycine--tRNA ligase subunit beta [Nitrosomonas sp.]
MTTKNLLVELRVEELPPKSLKQLGDSFAGSISASLLAQGLIQPDAPKRVFASPRRLAVWIAGVSGQAADKSVSQKLMPVKVGLDADGQATPPLLKKLISLGADASAVSRLKHVQEDKTEVLFFDSIVPGARLVEGLQTAITEAIERLPIPKVMTYQLADGWSSVHFVRPAHSLIALHGADILPVRILGIDAGRETQGHRFEAKDTTIQLYDADSYARQLLEEGAVIASFDDRRKEIRHQLDAAAKKENLVP